MTAGDTVGGRRSDRMRRGAPHRRRRHASHLLAVILVVGVVGALASLLITPNGARATSITVNTELDPAPDTTTGHYPTDGKCSLRAAIESAQNNSNANDVDCSTGLGGGVLDTIHIDASLAGKTLTLTYAKPFTVISGPDNPLEIIGPTTSAAGFVIDGNNATRIFEAGWPSLGNDSRGVLRLANLTIKRGNGHHNGTPNFGVDGDGGAMYLGDGTQLTLDNVVLRDNVVSASARGAAIYGIRPVITNNGGAYIANQAQGDGGTGSGGGRGGAIFMEQGPSVLNGYAVLFDGNAAAYAGGAIATNPGSSTAFVHLERSLAKSNVAKVGGVMYIDSSWEGLVFELADSTMTANHADQGGGVFFSQASGQTFSFLRDTFVGNSGTAGLFSAGGGTIANSIIVDSGCQNMGGGSGFSSIRNLVGGTNTGCAFVDDIGTITNLAPTLAQNGGPEVQQTFALQAGSNAIDNGSATYCGTVDARSIPRGMNGAGAVNSPQPGDCDIGAYEYADYIVNFVTGTSSVLEGQSNNVQVRLKIPDPAKRPLAATLTVNVSRNAASTARYPIDFTMGTGTVTFPTGSGDGAIANVAITTMQDDIAERFGENIILDLGGGEGVVVAEPKQHELSIQDDDQAGFVKTDGGNGTTVSEAAPATTDSFSIALRSRPDYSQPDPNDSNSYGPAADVVAHIEPDRDCTILAGGSTGSLGHPVDMTILNADWQAPHQITVTPIDDPWDEDLRDESAPHTCTVTFTFTSGDPVYNATTDAYDVRVIDNDVAGVTVVVGGGTTQLVEGGATDTYTVVLETPPDPGKPLPSPPHDVTVVATPGSQCDTGSGRGVGTGFSFTGSNWNVPQTVTVTAYDDLTVELDHSCVVTNLITSRDPVYANLDDPPAFSKTPASVTASIKDFEPPTITNDPPNVVISTGGGVTVDEATSTVQDTLSVVLYRQPLGANVTVTLSASSDPRIPGSQLLLQDDKSATPDAPAASLTLTFAPTDWNVAQTVRVFAVNDDYDEADPHTATITGSIVSAAPGFANATLRKFVVDGVESADTGTIPVTVVDNDVSSVVVIESAGSTAVTEGGSGDSFTFHLGTHPYNDVTVTVTPGPQCDVGSGGGVARTYPVAAGDWNTEVTVNVSAVDDRLVEAPATCAITTVATSADTLYNGLAGPAVTASVADNDPPRVMLSSPGGGLNEAYPSYTWSYAVVLGNQPDADVTVIPTTDGQTTVSPATVTFTNGNWNVSQTVTVSVVDDKVDEDTLHASYIHHAVSSTATGFATGPEIWVNSSPGSQIVLPVEDDDTAAVTVVESGGATAVAEGGATDAYTVVLATQPVAPVTVAVTPGAQCSATPAALVFDATTWATAQTVTVSATDDVVVEGAHACTLTHAATSTDPKYQGIAAAAVTAAVADNDVPLVSITASGLTLSEAAATTTAGYSVVLGAAPLAEVMVTATVSDGQTALSAGGATDAVVTFGPTNWNVPQTVTVWVVDDPVQEATPHTGTISHSVASTAPGFGTAPLLKVNGQAGTGVTVAITDDDAPDLDLRVADGGATVVPGGTVAYTLTWSNSGSAASAGAVVTETVPANTTFVAGSSTGTWSCPDGSPAGTTCRYTIGAVAGHATGTAIFTVRLASPAPAGLTSITNTASIADSADPYGWNNTATDTTDVVAAPDLRITNSDGGVTVVPNGTANIAVYTLTYGNFGNQNATNVRVTEIVPANSTFLAARSLGAWSCANGAPAGAVCTVTIGNLAAGATGTLKFAVKVTNTVPAGVAALTNVASIADDGANGPDPVPADNTATDATPVNAAPDLAIVVDDGGASAVPSKTLTYQLRYSNAGNQGATGVVLTEQVPAYTTFDPVHSTPGWSWTGSAWTMSIGSLPAGGSGVVTFAVTVNAVSSSVKEITNTASIADDGANGTDPRPTTNTSTDKSPVKKR